MIPELIAGFSVGIAILNGVAGYLMYRQYSMLAESSLEFAEIVITSLHEQEDGSILVDPMALAGVSMDHLNMVSGLVKWMRIRG